ncbi:MAG: CPBP family intramembrane metalloprotease [Clostridium sp.]|uniref:CPBP family intramembrane glutamic endopeptidase n=1 Tax=Clostridium sp. DSM 8431 TaxID=1761781 RepID=UPI0008EE66B2|nr:type II CAAX endopeptidase family protein [Clostridium sp. DSM 8431]MCR4942925.1 CPBP family intramembrane metalloprotease [Clostridium sp.]SFU56429.1 hypothetical protein SAMN04487886_10594 [Clostridium sp. DSM 8431]
MKKICKNDLYRSNIYFLLILLGSIFIPFVLAYVFYFAGIRDTRIKLVLSHIILFLVPAVIYFIVTKKSVKKTLRLNKLHIEDIGVILLIAVLMYPLMTCTALISSLFVHNNIGDYMTSISSTPYVVMILLFGVMPAITEEVTLRGIVLSGYNNQSKFKAALVTGIFFGIFHLDLHQFLYASVLGFVMAYLVRVTNSIFSSMIVHFTVNSMSVTMQKIASLSTSTVTEASDSIDLTALSFDQKMMYINVAVIVGICIFGLIFKLLKMLERWDYERKLVYGMPLSEEGYRGNSEKESIINIPLILIIVVYVIAMFIFK